MTLAEMSPEIEGNQEDVVTRLAFVCTVCGPKAIFPTSPFSKTYPTNYSLNKLLTSKSNHHYLVVYVHGHFAIKRGFEMKT